MTDRDPDAPGPNRPAEAAVILMVLMPAWYWDRPPPASGVALSVSARDGRLVTWCMSEGLAAAVVGRLRRDRRITHIHGSAYEDRAEEAA